MINQKLQQKLLQKLSPQQIQLMRLLELPVMQLEQRIKKEIEENPTLEEFDEEYSNISNDINTNDDGETENSDDKFSDEFSMEDYMPDDEYDIPEYRLSTNNHSKDEEQYEHQYSGGITFHENLTEQVRLLNNISEETKNLAIYLIGNIDEEGYLRRKLTSISDDLLIALNIKITESELQTALSAVQELDPAGVGAYDLQECLLLQLKRLDNIKPEVKNAETIIQDFFEEFTRKHYEKIIVRMAITEEELKLAIEEIQQLNPKPANAFNDPSTVRDDSFITPDFTVENTSEGFVISLNSINVPSLKINRTYSEMIENYTYRKKKISSEEKGTIQFIKQKIDSAKWFIDALQQRQNTLLQTMEAILSYQIDYFKTGDESKLRPMILKDIADVTGLDISTISRVANSKYIQTEYGIMQLKFFFSDSITTDSGEVSTREVKNILQECVNSEDKRTPLIDDELTAILNDRGYPIARRTTAKYREQLNIPVARLRKEI